MLAQSASSGVQLRWQLARGSNVVVAGSATKSFLLSQMDTPETPDGVGATIRTEDPMGIFSPTITYRSLLILDQELLRVFEMLFNGSVNETVNFGGDVVSIPRNLILKYPSHRVFDYIHPQGVSSSYYSLPCSEPSVRGFFCRFVPVEFADATVSKAPDWYSADGKALVVRSLALKIGSATYPLSPIINESSANLVLTEHTKVTGGAVAANNAALRSSNLQDSASAMSAYDIEGKHILTPFKEVSYASVHDDTSNWDRQFGNGFYDPNDAVQTCRSIHPFTMSLENSSSTLEVHEISRDALFGVRGLDCRSISEIRFEVSLGHSANSATAGTYNFVAPTAPVRVVLGVIYDSCMSIQRGSIDSEYQYALF